MGNPNSTGRSEEREPESPSKLKLYDGKTLAGFTEDNIKELRYETVREGMRRHFPSLYSRQDLQRTGGDIRMPRA